MLAMTACCTTQAGITVDTWEGVGGYDVSDMTGLASYPTNPASSTVWTNGLEAPQNVGNNFGRRVYGYLHPPATGSYKFWIASRARSEMWLSSDDSQTNKSKRCISWSTTTPRNWLAHSRNESDLISLTAGEKYFIEVLHKAGSGDDHVAVAWNLGGTTNVIADEYLTVFTNAPPPQPPPPPPAGYPAVRPNILIYFVDDMGWGDCQSYSTNSLVDMPNVEALATAGMSFSDAHTQGSLCAPSRYSILAGNYPGRGKSEGGTWIFNQQPQFLDGQRSIANVLQDEGYNTAMFGKAHLGGLVWPIDPGADFDTAAIQDSDRWKAMDFTRPITNCVVERGFNYSFISYSGLQDPPYAFFENDLLVGDTNNLIHWA